jgi:hypothetical protein
MIACIATVLHCTMDCCPPPPNPPYDLRQSVHYLVTNTLFFCIATGSKPWLPAACPTTHPGRVQPYVLLLQSLEDTYIMVHHGNSYPS